MNERDVARGMISVSLGVLRTVLLGFCQFMAERFCEGERNLYLKVTALNGKGDFLLIFDEKIN